MHPKNEMRRQGYKNILSASFDEMRKQTNQPRLTTDDYHAIAKRLKSRYEVSHIVCVPTPDNSEMVNVEVVDVIGPFNTTAIKNDDKTLDVEKELLATIDRLAVQLREVKLQNKELVDVVIKRLTDNV